MNLTAEERVRAKARKVTKKHKFLLPVIFLILLPIVAVLRIVGYFGRNGKRYIVMGMALVFFFMSSSFSFPENGDDSAIYLASSEPETSVENVDADEASLISEDAQKENIADADWIEDADLLSKDLEEELSKTDNIDVFTLDDFLKETADETYVADSEESAFDKDAWNLILVNKTHPVPADYDVPLTTFSDTMKCDERVLEPLTFMLKGASRDGVDLIVCSPYRDYQLQERLFNRKVTAYMNKGYSYVDAYKMTCSNVTVPGASEHQIGMAFDIVTGDHRTLDYEFENTAAGKWLKAHSKEYGFILRYPRGKTDITGIIYEPWHFRYVGVEAATYIMDNDLTLEEFIESLE